MDRLIKSIETPCINPDKTTLARKPLSFICAPHGSDRIRDEISSFELSRLLPYIDDLGDLATKDINKIAEALQEYAEARHPLVVFMPVGSISALSKDFWASFDHPVHVSSRVLQDHSEVAHLGVQRHYYNDQWDFDPHKHLRLSTIRHFPEQAEVILRTADCVVIRLDVLRLSDNLGSQTCSTAGLTIEELCMVAKYAGASTQLKTILIEGYEQNADDHGTLAKNAALLTYYILDGFEIRSREAGQSEQLQRYSLIPEHISQELVFIEDQRSSRWWVELYSGAAEKVVHMPCTRKDYEDACQNVISDRLTTLLTST